MFAANGTIVRTYDCITLRLDLGLQRGFLWHFVITNVTGSIIGLDFLCFYNLLVDIRHRRFINNITNLTVNGASVGTYGGHIKFLARSSRYHAMLQGILDIICPAGIPQKSWHSKFHHISTMPGASVTSCPLRLALDSLPIAKSEFEECSETALLGVLIAPGLQPSTSSPRKKTAGDPVVTIML